MYYLWAETVDSTRNSWHKDFSYYVDHIRTGKRKRKYSDFFVNIWLPTLFQLQPPLLKLSKGYHGSYFEARNVDQWSFLLHERYQRCFGCIPTNFSSRLEQIDFDQFIPRSKLNFYLSRNDGMTCSIAPGGDIQTKNAGRRMDNHGAQWSYVAKAPLTTFHSAIGVTKLCFP